MTETSAILSTSGSKVFISQHSCMLLYDNVYLFCFCCTNVHADDILSALAGSLSLGGRKRLPAVPVYFWPDPTKVANVAANDYATHDAFLWALRNAFADVLIEEGFLVYLLPSRGLWQSARKKIETDDQLANAIRSIINAGPGREQPMLFVVPGTDSPNTSPGKTAKGDGKSVSSGRSSIRQADFRTRVLHRDDSICVFCRCNEEAFLEAAHLLDVEEQKAPTELATKLKSLDLPGLYELVNGITLCIVCHAGFDAHLVFVDTASWKLVVADALQSCVDYPRWKALHGADVKRPDGRDGWPTPALWDHRKSLCDAARAARHTLAVTTIPCKSCFEPARSEKTPGRASMREWPT